MADIDVDRPELFPAGTEVGIYLSDAITDLEKPPIGKAVQSQTVGAVEVENEETEEMETEIDGSISEVTFTGLSATPRNYIVGGKVGETWRYLRVVVGKLGASLKPPARFPNHKPGN